MSKSIEDTGDAWAHELELNNRQRDEEMPTAAHYMAVNDMLEQRNFFITEFCNQIKSYMSYGAVDIPTAIRWMLDANAWDESYHSRKELKKAKQATYNLNRWPTLKHLDEFMRALGLYNSCLPDVHLLNHNNAEVFGLSMHIAEAANLSNSDISIIARQYPSFANRWVRNQEVL